jgi:flagellar hook assembly protein FlgD
LNCYPNPMKESSALKYHIPTGRTGELEIYNTRGQLIRLFAGLPSNIDHIDWDGKNKAGSIIPNGMYYLKLTAGSKSIVSKITKVR